MTRKDYILLAHALAGAFPISENVTPVQAWELAVKAVSDALKSDNPRFDAERFDKACKEG